jgi:hypothetical protein
MSQKGKNAHYQLNVRMSMGDLEGLRKCQAKLGGLSQSDAIRILILLFLGKVPRIDKWQKRTATLKQVGAKWA